nr:hypothetical protein [Tanacetum cinerariifolium]
MNSHNIIEMDDLESDDGSINTPLVSPFLDSDDESDDGEVLNELDDTHPTRSHNILPYGERESIRTRPTKRTLCLDHPSVYELRAISAMINSHLGQPLNKFMNSHNIIEMDDLESDDGLVDTPLVFPFLDSDDESDDGEVLNELDEYGNAGNFYRNRIINRLDREDVAFSCMIGFRKLVAYFDPFFPMNIIMRKAYNTIMVEGLKSIRRNLVAIVRDVYVFVGSFTYVTDFVVLEDIGEL